MSETQSQVKPSKIKRDARKKRFELIMPGGRVDTAFTRLFNVYKKLDDKRGAAHNINTPR